MCSGAGEGSGPDRAASPARGRRSGRSPPRSVTPSAASRPARTWPMPPGLPVMIATRSAASLVRVGPGLGRCRRRSCTHTTPTRRPGSTTGRYQTPRQSIAVVASLTLAALSTLSGALPQMSATRTSFRSWPRASARSTLFLVMTPIGRKETGSGVGALFVHAVTVASTLSASPLGRARVLIPGRLARAVRRATPRVQARSSPGAAPSGS